MTDKKPGVLSAALMEALGKLHFSAACICWVRADLRRPKVSDVKLPVVTAMVLGSAFAALLGSQAFHLPADCTPTDYTHSTGYR